MREMVRTHLKSRFAPNLVSRGLFIFYLLTVLTAVLPYGAVRQIPLSLLAGLVCITGLAALLIEGTPSGGKWLFNCILAAEGLVVVWVLVQIYLFLPGFAVGIDFGTAHAAGTNSAISVERSDSLSTIINLATPGVTFLTGLIILTNDDRRRLLVSCLTIGGGVFALYGIVQLLVFPRTNLFSDKVAYIDSVTATFVNRNSAGTLLGIVCLAAVRQVWTLLPQVRAILANRSLITQRVRDDWLLQRFCLFLIVLALATIALLLTKSRGAVASTGIALVVLSVLLKLSTPTEFAGTSQITQGLRRRLFVATITSVFVVSIAISAFGGRVLLRAESQTQGDSRFCVLPGMLQTASEHPIVGFGAGTFRYAYAPNRDPSCGIYFIWDRAHNVYLEGWITLGAIFFVIFGMAAGALVFCHIVGLRTRRRMCSYPALGLASILLVAIHSMVDFSVQIAGVSTFFSALLAATSAISLGRRSPDGRDVSDAA